MKLEHLSASSMDSFATCPRRAYLTKSLDTPKVAETPATVVGRAVHKALQIYHSETLKEGVTLPDLFDTVLKDYQFFDPRRFHDAHVYLKNYEANNPADSPTLAVEKEFEFEVEGFKFYGIIDRIDYEGDGKYHIIDYKTSFVKKPPWEVADDPQLLTYDIALRKMYEQGDEIFDGLPEPKEVECTLYYLRYEPVSTTFTDEARASMLDYQAYMGFQIEMMDEEPPGNLNVFCRWCQFSGNCYLFNSEFRDMSEGDLNKPVEELLLDLDKLKLASAILKKRVETIEGILLREMDSMGEASLDTSVGTAQATSRRMKKYTWSGIKSNLPGWEAYSTFDSKAFEANATPEEREIVKKFTKEFQTRPSIKVKMNRER